MQLLSRLAASSGGLLNRSSRGKELGEKTEVIESWLKILERVRLVRRLRNYDDRKSNPLRHTTKCYISDPGMLSFLNQWEDSEFIKLLAEKGILVESFALIELTALISVFPHGPVQLYYYRNASDKEVDFVLVCGKIIVGIEVKSSDRIRPSSLDGLRHLRDEVGAHFACGVVLYTGSEVRYVEDRLYVVPMSRLWSAQKGITRVS